MKNELNVDQIKKLWILDLIIQNGSLKGAAAQAKITPSAVSQSLTSLERNVGRPLIVRKNGSIAPTQDAISILQVVRPAFEAFGRLSDLGSQPVPQMSWLNFGTYESIAVDILPGLLHRLRERMPNLRLGLRIGRSKSLVSMVRKGELCSAIVTELDELERFYRVPLAEDRLGVFISAQHPLAGNPAKALAEAGLGALAAGPEGFPRYYTKFVKRLGATKTSVVSESFETLRAAAAGGAIAAVLPARVASRQNDLIEITPEGSERDAGKHGIFVISPLNCDREEADFLASECSRLLLK